MILGAAHAFKFPFDPVTRAEIAGCTLVVYFA